MDVAWRFSKSCTTRVYHYCYTETIPVAAYKHNEKEIYGIQFHPEVSHSLDGKKLFYNFW
jgi:GMP synthase-like glutamine amidotransferase